MTEIQQYQAPAEVALPRTASTLVEWAQGADAAYALAEKLTRSAFCPQQFQGKPVDAAAAMLAGSEVGLSPMASLRAFDVIQGQAAPRALTLRAVAQSLGHEIVVDESTSTKCVARGRRKGSQEWQSVTWTMDRARQLGVTNKPNWKNQPTAMLVARATSEVARLIAADAILGIGYSVEEIEDAAPEPTTTRQRSAPKQVRRKPAPEPDLEPNNVDYYEPEVQGTTTAPQAADDEGKPNEDGVSQAQLKMMHALFNKAGYPREQREERLAYVKDVVGREVPSSSYLTKQEASRVIDRLTSDVDVDDPAKLPSEPPLPGWEE